MLTSRSCIAGLVFVAASFQAPSSVSAFLTAPTPIHALSRGTEGLSCLPTCGARSSCTATWAMALASAKKAKKSALQKALQKPSGALTVSLEYRQEAGKSQLEREILSCQLRKEKVASLWVDRETLADFSREQSASRGDFPGPCPVVLREAVASQDDLDFVKGAGASAVVIEAGGANAADLAEGAEKLSLTPVWKVSNEDEVTQASDAGGSIFLVTADAVQEHESLLDELPKKSIWLAEISSMQPKNMEVDQSRAMKAKGCKAMLVSGACVGDEEDLPYARWVVAEMSSKASSEFKITGMTGHVNGHYGTGTFEKSNSDLMWKRGNAD